MTPVDYARARRALARRDPIMGDLMRRQGSCGLARRQHADPFVALTRAIISQQLSSKAAATIAGRFDALCGAQGPTPAAVEALSDVELRAAGLSRPKIGYLRDLCLRIRTGALRLEAIETLPDDGVIAALTQVKGIGRWTAEMFLIFRLHRPDVLPVGDLGILKAVQRVYGLRKVPTPDRLTRIGESWRPYRSIACWYLWASLDNAPLKE
jgi:DNA-3-methyladenine glycosylase II